MDAPEIADNNAGVYVRNMVSRDTDSKTYINTSGYPSSIVLPLLEMNYMVVNLSRSNKLQQQDTPDTSAQQQHLDQKLPTSRDIVMDIMEMDGRGLPQRYGAVTYGSQLSFDGVLRAYFRDISSITLFTRTTIDVDSKNDFNRLSLDAWHGQFYWVLKLRHYCHACGDI